MNRWIRWFNRFLKLSLLEKIQSIKLIYWRLKSRWWYGLFLGAIGKGSYIHSPLVIARPDRIFLGNRVSIGPGARLEIIQSSETRLPSLIVGDGTNFEQNVHIACHSKIVIGENVSITARCSIVDVNHPFVNPDLTKSLASLIEDECSYVEIGDRVLLGIGTVVLPNVRIGEGAVIGANSVVTRDIPPFAIAAGAPAKVLRIYQTDSALKPSLESSCE